MFKARVNIKNIYCLESFYFPKSKDVRSLLYYIVQ